MSAPEQAEKKPFNPWLMGLLIAFGVVLTANGILIYLAVQNSPEIVPSYDLEPR